MKIYIFADLEGSSGVSGAMYETIDKRHGAKGIEFMLGDVNCCVDACFKAGATEVIVKDGHGGGMNLIRDLVDSRADLIDGDTPQIRFADLEGAEGLILLGYHAMAGTPAAVLDHTFNPYGIQNMWLNGLKVGEFGIDAAIAGEYDVPVIMTSGDDKLCMEAHQWSPETITCELKKGFAASGARLISIPKAHALIREKTMEAIARRKSIRPLKIQPPITIRWEYCERNRIYDNTAYTRIDNRTQELTGDNVERLFFFNA